jgi:hypothetical protein
MPRHPPLSALLPAVLALAGMLAATPVQARALEARIARVDTAVAVLRDVQVRLDWPAQSPHGELSLRAGSVTAADLGYRYRNLRWTCPLRRDGARWRCDGEVRSGDARPLRLGIDLDDARTDAVLAQGRARLALHRDAATPDDTRIDLTRVPLAWAQALLAQAWPQGQMKSGELSGQVGIHAATGKPLAVHAALRVAGAGFDTPDASIAGEQLGGAFTVDYRSTPARTRLDVAGQLRGGEFLVGSAYVALPDTPVEVAIAGVQASGQGWSLSRIHWRDGGVLRVDGSAGFDRDANLHALDLALHSDDVSLLPARYLSGWLGQAGLADLAMQGAFDARLRMDGAVLASASATLHDIDVSDPKGRFRFDGLAGTTRFSGDAPVRGELRWQGGQLYGLDFAAATLPITSSDGELRLRDPVSVPMLGGTLRFDGMTLRPPAGGNGADIGFGLTVDALDVGRLATALDLPAFQGQLSGRIPSARYRDQVLAFDGGLNLQLFGGTVRVSSLALERPFGVAPSLSADLALDDIDLMALTGVFDFGSISGKLDGRIDGLRLVDWTATAFDAELHTDRHPGVRQRISQRAVQNISSVGDASFTTTLQSQLIGLFDDFGYSRLGISCRLANEVCEMGGLHPAEGAHSRGGFTIVDGAGIPHLTVVGFNRQVDWPTLLERLAAASAGDVTPVVK